MKRAGCEDKGVVQKQRFTFADIVIKRSHYTVKSIELHIIWAEKWGGMAEML